MWFSVALNRIVLQDIDWWKVTMILMDAMIVSLAENQSKRIGGDSLNMERNWRV